MDEDEVQDVRADGPGWNATERDSFVASLCLNSFSLPVCLSHPLHAASFSSATLPLFPLRVALFFVYWACLYRLLALSRSTFGVRCSCLMRAFSFAVASSFTFLAGGVPVAVLSSSFSLAVQRRSLSRWDCPSLLSCRMGRAGLQFEGHKAERGKGHRNAHRGSVIQGLPDSGC